MGPQDILPSPRLAPCHNEIGDEGGKQLWRQVACLYHQSKDSVSVVTFESNFRHR